MAMTGVMLMAFLAVFSCNKKIEGKMIKGMLVVDNVVGEGLEAEKFDILTVHYTGKLEDGTVFDSSKNPGRDPFTVTIGIGQVIKGWDEAIALMKEGGTAKLIIPSDLAYGATGSGSIPAYTTLVFYVELVDVE